MSKTIIITLLILAIICNLIGLFILKKIKQLDIQPVRFLGVGVLNTLVYTLSFTLLNINLPYLVAHVTSFLISAAISYVLTTVYTFGNKVSVDTAIRFPLTFLPNLIMSTIGTFLLVHFELLSDDYASIVMMLAAIPITFIVGKVLLSPKEK